MGTARWLFWSHFCEVCISYLFRSILGLFRMPLVSANPSTRHTCPPPFCTVLQMYVHEKGNLRGKRCFSSISLFINNCVQSLSFQNLSQCHCEPFLFFFDFFSYPNQWIINLPSFKLFKFLVLIKRCYLSVQHVRKLKISLKTSYYL